MTDAALTRMPHKGRMLLLASVEALTEREIRCRAKDHRGVDYPLRLDGVLHPIALVELGAQAAAAHASIHGVGGAHAGLLLALKDVRVHREDEPRAPLMVQATRLGDGPGGAQYSFEIWKEDGMILTGEALLAMRALP
ncbi:MAG: hypothetical protein AAF908_12420 [Pseudomonadota bacterium]